MHVARERGRERGRHTTLDLEARAAAVIPHFDLATVGSRQKTTPRAVEAQSSDAGSGPRPVGFREMKFHLTCHFNSFASSNCRTSKFPRIFARRTSEIHCESLLTYRLWHARRELHCMYYKRTGCGMPDANYIVCTINLPVVACQTRTTDPTEAVIRISNSGANTTPLTTSLCVWGLIGPTTLRGL
jgi:hypothetical protein